MISVVLDQRDMVNVLCSIKFKVCFYKKSLEFFIYFVICVIYKNIIIRTLKEYWKNKRNVKYIKSLDIEHLKKKLIKNYLYKYLIQI